MTVQGPLLLPPGSYTKKETGKASCAVRHKRILKHLCLTNETLTKFKPQKWLQLPGTFLSFLSCYFLSCSLSRCKAWSQARMLCFSLFVLTSWFRCQKSHKWNLLLYFTGTEESHCASPPILCPENMNPDSLCSLLRRRNWYNGTKSGRPHLSHWEAPEPLPGK